MLLYSTKLDAVPAVQKQYPKAVDVVTVADMPGFLHIAKEWVPSSHGFIANDTSEWAGGDNHAELVRKIEEGDLALAAQTDRMMKKLEDAIPLTPKRGWRDDIVGSVPNVQAFIAGIPTSMRRRVNHSSANAPISIIVDLVSGWEVTASDVRKRGAALLTLLRVLSNIRPVEFWYVVGQGEECASDLGGVRAADYLAVRLETSPLDLARAAFMLGHPGPTRQIAYNRFHKTGFGRIGASLPFAYGDRASRVFAGEAVSRVISPSSETLFVPGLISSDPILGNPVKWLREQLTSYGGLSFEGEDDEELAA